jgi:uncharacterized membrane-anchored protein YitT (DUF2179 family)
MIVKLLDDEFREGYTLFTGHGHFRGVSERCLVIEVFTRECKRVSYVAEMIRELNCQQTVLVLRIPVGFTMIPLRSKRL